MSYYKAGLGQAQVTIGASEERSPFTTAATAGIVSGLVILLIAKATEKKAIPSVPALAYRARQIPRSPWS